MKLKKEEDVGEKHKLKRGIKGGWKVSRESAYFRVIFTVLDLLVASNRSRIEA